MDSKEVIPIDMAKAESMCVCKSCPTYFDCDEPLAFCLYDTGASGCITVGRGCICPGCPVYGASGFESDFYCIVGSEEAHKNPEEAIAP